MVSSDEWDTPDPNPVEPWCKSYGDTVSHCRWDGLEHGDRIKLRTPRGIVSGVFLCHRHVIGTSREWVDVWDSKRQKIFGYGVDKIVRKTS